MPPSPERRAVDVDGRRLELSNLAKVLYPATGTTKGEVVDYYTRVAPVLLPHLAGRPVTLRRCPDGVGADCFYEKNCPEHRPAWVRTVEPADGPRYCLVEDRATVVWLANLAALELHPNLHRAAAPDEPTMVVFDLDPGPPAGAIAAARVALRIRDQLAALGLRTLVKTSGRKGVQVYLPLNSPVTYEATRRFAHAVALLLERQEPERVVSRMNRELRRGKVLVDWSQNVAAKTTVAVYALRENERPTVSTPVAWDEVEAAVEDDDPQRFVFEIDEVLERVERDGDRFVATLDLRQRLPDVRSALDGRDD